MVDDETAAFQNGARTGLLLSKLSGKSSSTFPTTLPSLKAPCDASSSSSEAERLPVERPEPPSLLDELLSVRLNAYADSNSDGVSSDYQGSADFSIRSSQHVSLDWLQQQPKKDVELMAVMAMDTITG